MDTVQHFLDKIGLTNTIVGSLIVLTIGFLLQKTTLRKTNKKTDAETLKIKTENYITKEKFRKEELAEALEEVKILKEDNRELRRKLDEASERIDKLIRRINVLETFYTLEINK